MDNLIELNQKELRLINGGSFAWDAGWLIGNTLSGSFSTTSGQVGAIADYIIHYIE